MLPKEAAFFLLERLPKEVSAQVPRLSPRFGILSAVKDLTKALGMNPRDPSPSFRMAGF
jgi:hypothetical protein